MTKSPRIGHCSRNSRQIRPVIGPGSPRPALHTKTKTSAGAFTRFGAAPNSNVCPVCPRLPGTRCRVLNKRAVARPRTRRRPSTAPLKSIPALPRKNYFYPDLPKGLQILRNSNCVATGGWLESNVNGAKKRIGIAPLASEEDAGKSLHDGFPHGG